MIEFDMPFFFAYVYILSSLYHIERYESQSPGIPTTIKTMGGFI